MGAVTGKGLSDLIREEFGLRATFFSMIVFGLADFGTIAARFAGLFGISKYISVPIGAVLVWAVIVYGSYRSIERLLLVCSLVYLAYPVSAIYGASRLARRHAAELRARSLAFLRLLRHGRWAYRNHDHAVDAVLLAGVGGGKRRDQAAVPDEPLGCERRLLYDRDRHIFHHGRMRGNCTSVAFTRSTMPPMRRLPSSR